jgi:hypothetical protein
MVIDRILNGEKIMAKRLKTTKEEIAQKTIDSYAERINPKNRLMKFAGILSEEEADQILNTIHNSRQT